MKNHTEGVPVGEGFDASVKGDRKVRRGRCRKEREREQPSSEADSMRSRLQSPPSPARSSSSASRQNLLIVRSPWIHSRCVQCCALRSPQAKSYSSPQVRMCVQRALACVLPLRLSADTSTCTRRQFVTLLSRLTSSLPSIQKVSSFAFKHGPRCGDDLWDCLVEEVGQVSLNARINLLYFLDSLLDKQGPGQPYKELVKRDLGKVVEMVVPSTREGALNLMSVNQVSAERRASSYAAAHTSPCADATVMEDSAVTRRRLARRRPQRPRQAARDVRSRAHRDTLSHI